MLSIIDQSLLLPSPLQKLESKFLTNKNIELFLKRDDLIHQDISGNKWRKLKYNLLEAKNLNKNVLISFGGMFSNHLVALAAAGSLFDFKTIGYVRGDFIDESNKTIQFLRKHQMELIPISRTQFRNLNNESFLQSLNDKHSNSFIIPLGGTNKLALMGIEEMMDELIETNIPFNYICTPIGSGGTAAGIIKKDLAKTLVFNSFKKDFTKNLIESVIDKPKNWESINEYHFGGFAKTKPALIQFIKTFKSQFNVPLEYVYNGKMMYGILDMIEKDQFKSGDKILAIHTGGLQGNLYL